MANLGQSITVGWVRRNMSLKHSADNSHIAHVILLRFSEIVYRIRWLLLLLLFFSSVVVCFHELLISYFVLFLILVIVHLHLFLLSYRFTTHEIKDLDDRASSVTNLSRVHTTPEEFETSNVFRPHYAAEIWKCNNHRSFWICVQVKLKQGNITIVITPSLMKSFVFKMFCVHTKTQSRRFQIPTGLKNVFEKLCFRDGLVWIEGLTVEIQTYAMHVASKSQACFITVRISS